MLASRLIIRSSVRTFSTTGASQAEFGSWLKFLNPTARKEKAQLKEKLSNIDAKNEEADAILNSDSKVTGATNPSNLEIIGLPQQLTKEEFQRRLGNFKVNTWLNTKKITTVEQLDEILLSSWKEIDASTKITNIEELVKTELYDLNVRFQYFKKVQQQSGYSVSDLVLTESSTIKILRSHFVHNVLSREAMSYNEKLPNALHLDENSFKDLPNVVIDKEIKQKDIKKKFNKLLKQVEEHNSNKIELALNS